MVNDSLFCDPKPFTCSMCPRRCEALRNNTDGYGYCGMGVFPRIARAMPHYGEEPCISGLAGSGTVFFSGCSLGCIFCQNDLLSHEGLGKDISLLRLRKICEALAEECENVSFVTASHYMHIVEALLREPLGKPVVFNTGGYDSVESLRSLEGKINVYLPDLKFFSPIVSKRFANAEDYFEVASAAVAEMVRQTGPCVFDEDGILIRGTMIRHLVLPGFSADSINILRWCRDNLAGVRYSVMSQYTPYGAAKEIRALSRTLKQEEYDRVIDFLAENEMEGYCQELSSAGEETIPDFKRLEFFGDNYRV